MLMFRFIVYSIIAIFVAIFEGPSLGFIFACILMISFQDHMFFRAVIKILNDKINTLQIEILIGDEDDKS